ncbi:MAG: peptidylprolyl isomerase [Bryobacterales bacterium]|nr:peptidylprolyl isomerase [Bryobacterales bacterium]
MTGILDSGPSGDAGRGSPGGWPRAAVRILVACMALLGAAAGWLVLTRPVHRIEGDFLEREDRQIADEWLSEQLRNPVAEIRARAYLALSRIDRREATDRLLLATQDPAPSVRAAAAFALGNTHDSRLDGERAPDAAATSPALAPRIRIAGLDVGRAPDEAAIALMGLLADDERAVVARAVEALGKLGRRDAAEAITGTAAPIATAMTALMRMQSASQSAFVAEYLDSDDQDSRWAAALAAGHLGLVRVPEVWSRLLPLVTDDNEFVRAAALRAVAAGEPSESLAGRVRSGLEHRDPKVRFEALTALASFEGSPPAVDLPAGEPRLDSRTTPAPETLLLADGDYQRVAKTLGARLLLRTSQGDFEIELDYDHAPLTSEHFRRLANAGLLDDSAFIAVRPNGYAVAAAPLGPIRSELNPKPFLRGSIGLLRQGDASGSGFFVCLTALPLAHGRYVNFGRLVSGDRLLDSIAPGAKVLSVRERR